MKEEFYEEQFVVDKEDDEEEQDYEEETFDEGEEGFMKGYEGEGNPVYCDKCHKLLNREFIEKEYKGESYKFCSEQCADEFEKKKRFSKS